MKTSLLFLASWLIGLCAYVGACALFYRQIVSVFPWAAIYFFIVFAIAFCFVYLPSLLALRRALGGVHPAWPFPVITILLGVLPTTLIIFSSGGHLRDLLTPDASLFHAMFGTSGLIVGIGFARIHRQERSLEVAQIST